MLRQQLSERDDTSSSYPLIKKPTVTMLTHKNFLLFWIPLVAYCGVIVYLSSIEGDNLPAVTFRASDKIFHMGEYIIVGVLFIRAYLHSLRGKRSTLHGSFLTAIGFSTLFGASDEMHQLFVPGRFCSGWDLAADVVGSALGVILYLRWWKRSSHD
jgi:VanZ family protein